MTNKHLTLDLTAQQAAELGDYLLDEFGVEWIPKNGIIIQTHISRDWSRATFFTAPSVPVVCVLEDALEGRR